jgi:hypothetical protein
VCRHGRGGGGELWEEAQVVGARWRWIGVGRPYGMWRGGGDEMEAERMKSLGAEGMGIFSL